MNETFTSYARDSGKTIDAADGDPNFETLFGQCIRSPSPSPTPSSSPKDPISELSGTRLDARTEASSNPALEDL